MKVKMTTPISRRQRNRRRITWSQRALLVVEPPDEDLVQSQVRMEHEASGGIGLYHVRVGAIVATNGKAPRRSMGCLGGADLAGRVLDIGGRPQTTVGQNREHRNR